MTLQVQVHFEKVNTVAPSLLQPSKQLGSRTPMQLVGMSNLKLNREMYSPRAQSIHRRILIKNFLTMLYQRHPIEWIEDSPVDDKDHWMEQTLSAVGIEEHSDQYQSSDSGDYNYNNYNDDNPYRSNRGPSSGSSIPDSLLSRPSKVTPLPRPASGELPQSLHSYLSNVFDVDWSPDSNNTEDTFYTSKPSSRPASTSSPALASQLSQLSFSSATPSPASWTVAAAERKTRTPQRTRSFTGNNSNVGHRVSDSPGSLMREPSQDGTPRTTNGRQPQQQEEYMQSTQKQDPMPQPRPRIRTQLQLPSTHDTIDNNNYLQAGPGHIKSMETTPHHHYGVSDNVKRESVSRSTRYPKSPPMAPTSGRSRRGGRPSSSTSTSVPSEGPYSYLPHPKDSDEILDYPPWGHHTFGSSDDRPYLAASFPDYSDQHYPQSLPPPPPPPYSRSPSPAPLITSPPSSPPISPSPDLKISKSNRTQPVFESASAKLEYQQYQERQKQFVTDDYSEDSRTESGARGFIKKLSRQGSKKKVTTISAPLPKISSISGPLMLQDIPRQAPLQYPGANSSHGNWSAKVTSSKYTHPIAHQSPSPQLSYSVTSA
ncbi:hypothetical protein BGZ92_001362 [Podila epicladia]|nr:hypothetical protein BGZ92_001362 [Podila epicladia]